MHDAPLNERRHDYDWPLAAAVLGLMIIGTAFIFSATEGQTLYLRQVVWYVLGIGAAAAACYFEYGSLARWSAVFYWASMVLLVAVYAIGAFHHGAKRWIDLGAFNLQPSEFAKIGFILWLAHYLSRPQEELRRGKVFLGTLGYTLLPFILVLKEPDMGSALVFLAISLAMMFVAGVPGRLLGGLVGGVGLLVVLGVALILFAPVKLKILESYQSGRVLEYFGRKKSYNVEQALISVGSGGLTGKGWRQGTQHALGFLPSGGAHNDFIFSVIAEEEGFVGSVVILTLYTVLIFSGIKIASQARDRLGQIMAVGVVTLLFSHVFINIGMNIRLMPVAGIPLPLLSYGGSSVICSLIAIGILHNVHIYRRYH
ncbi:MAG TPA: rod shape-determining protein RodA [Verrucomicrobiae bacterium]|jgi:rod shape determining protein RodA|nr:rod shape-determining protein RodA [Verrucomicrobiae bacterium]